MIENSPSSEAIRVLSVKSKKNDTLWIYIINKEKDKAFSLINLHVDGFSPRQYKVIGFNANDNSEGPLKIEPMEIENNKSGNFKLKMPQYSLSRVTLVK
jgi:hypothetical protein